MLFRSFAFEERESGLAIIVNPHVELCAPDCSRRHRRLQIDLSRLASPEEVGRAGFQVDAWLVCRLDGFPNLNGGSFVDAEDREIGKSDRRPAFVTGAEPVSKRQRLIQRRWNPIGGPGLGVFRPSGDGQDGSLSLG